MKAQDTMLDPEPAVPSTAVQAGSHESKQHMAEAYNLITGQDRRQSYTSMQMCYWAGSPEQSA